MSVFILRWNPAASKYNLTTHREIISHLKKNEHPVGFSWNFHDWRRLEPDDVFIMVQTGTKHDGIAMIGKTREKCRSRKQSDGSGRRGHYAELLICDAFDCNRKNVLPVSRLEKLFPEIDWHEGESGVCIVEETGQRLLDEIRSQLIKAGIWKEDTFLRFMMAEIEPEIGDSDGIDPIISTSERLLYLKNHYRDTSDTDDLFEVLWCLKDYKVVVPMRVLLDDDDQKWLNSHSGMLLPGTEWKPSRGVSLEPDILEDQDGVKAYPMFTNVSQLPDDYRKVFSPVKVDVLSCIRDAKRRDITKLVLDPFSGQLTIPIEIADMIINLVDLD